MKLCDTMITPADWQAEDELAVTRAAVGQYLKHWRETGGNAENSGKPGGRVPFGYLEKRLSVSRWTVEKMENLKYRPYLDKTGNHKHKSCFGDTLAKYLFLSGLPSGMAFDIGAILGSSSNSWYFNNAYFYIFRDEKARHGLCIDPPGFLESKFRTQAVLLSWLRDLDSDCKLMKSNPLGLEKNLRELGISRMDIKSLSGTPFSCENLLALYRDYTRRYNILDGDRILSGILPEAQS